MQHSANIYKIGDTAKVTRKGDTYYLLFGKVISKTCNRYITLKFDDSNTRTYIPAHGDIALIG